MRARYPDVEGYVERDGVKVGYEVFGSGPTTVVFTPIDLIVHSRAWKAQIPYLSRFYRVVVIDARGNGRSDRPHDPALLTDRQLVSDTLAVMDEVGVDRAVVVGLCSSAWVAAVLAAEHPARVTGLFTMATWMPFLTPPHPHRLARESWDESMGPAVGWQMRCVNYWRKDWRGFVEFFFGELLPEPHSTKQWEDCVSWAMEVDLESMIATEDAPLAVSDRTGTEAMLARITCPVFAVHGTADSCQPASRSERFVELTGGRLVKLEGAGHLPQAREPVVVNRLLREFVEGLTPDRTPVRWTRSLNRPHKVLMVSSPIGLGHTRRDVAIAQELRTLRPEVQIDWLAQSPVSDVVTSRGERVHPASAFLASEVDHLESESAEHDLHAFTAIRRMDEILLTNFMVFDELVREEQYDAWIADEGWDVDYFLHENPELKSSAYAWLTDFVGWLPMPDGGEPERRLTSDYNAEMIEHVARFPRLRDHSLFVGDPDDCVPDGLGEGLPSVRQWTENHFDFTGYITGYQPLTDDDRLAVRAGLGWTDDENVVVVAVGGTAVGAPLLRRAVAAHPLVAAAVPGLRMVVVAGPRIDPASLNAPDGVEVRGYVPDLYRLLAASDLAVVQGGLTTTMELVANRRPFLYVPLRHHFEQTFHVSHRLARYGAGTRLDYDDTTPESLSAAIAAQVGKPVAYRPVATDGAAKAAQRIAELI